MHRLIQAEDVHSQIHGDHAAGRFNTWLALKITNGVGTMWCAYLFTLLALAGLPTALAPGGSGPVAWFAQTFIQLVLLSIIMVGQNISSAAQDARAETDHETLTLLDKINQQQLDILRRLDAEGEPSHG